MPKVKCAAEDCKYNSNKNTCTAKNISLGWISCMTLWDGRQEFWKCKSYEMSQESKEILDELNKITMQNWNTQILS